MLILKSLIVYTFIILFTQDSTAQNFLQTSGRAIVNENQDTILLKGMGLGGWMVQEGYMLQTSGFANPQHKIRETIEKLIGAEDTELFYEAWLSNHVRKSDIDSLKSWGFNSVRLPMHYNLFTLPIEDEPVVGEDTWLDKGFELTDQLIDWCKQNEMYVILDMHAAPGGQGMDAAISDYDDTKPSLWESAENRRKLVALWSRISDRYADEEWVGGYDLLNEVNWDLPGGNALRTIYQSITQEIRAKGDNHIVFIEGNWFANDFTGLTPPWTDNFVYSPHKYWSTNDEATMQWVIDLRNSYNVPLYLGETGENSNVWFRDAARLFEDLEMGWAWWPMKKVESVAGPLSIIKSPEYQTVLDYWSGNGSMPTAAFARDALMDLTEKLKIENCVYQKDVIDALFRQVYSDETIPFKNHTVPGVIHATDYDLGVVGSAYQDKNVANYQVSTGDFTSWNDGWAYRNDGVDIEKSDDTINSNGFNVGFMDVGEWMQYEVSVEDSGVYEAHIRTASGGSGGLFHLAIDGADITYKSFVGPTGGWQNWQTVIVPNLILKEDNKKLRFYTDVAGFNLASFDFVKTDINVEDLSNIFMSAQTIDEMTIQVTTNKISKESSLSSPGGFEVFINGTSIPITDVSIDAENNRIIKISSDVIMNSTQSITVTYTGTQIEAVDNTSLLEFYQEDVRNTLSFVHQIPGRVQSEDFVIQSGVELESTTDLGGGQNIGFLDVNDYLDYDVNVKVAGTYKIDYRTAAQFGAGGIQLQLIDAAGVSTIVNSPTFSSTGDWQTWATTSETVILPQGRYIMRVLITQAPFNMNWMDFDLITSIDTLSNIIKSVSVFPNPSADIINLTATLSTTQDVEIMILDMSGKILMQNEIKNVSQMDEVISIKDLQSGAYILKMEMSNGDVYNKRFLKI
ncbi:MAG: endoglucanase [Saprospiraceae bacterium]|jgi:aryl-phospho-beta-D-glucosidase BglC (GH1 family)